MEFKRWPMFLAMTFMFSFRAFAFAQELNDKPDVPSLNAPQTSGAIVAEDVKDEDDKSVSGEPSPTIKLDDLLKLDDANQSGQPVELPKFMIGVSLAEVPASLRAHIKLEDKQGIMVGLVVPDSPADKAGLQQYDIILSSGDKTLSHPRELQALVDAAGEKPVTVTVQRRGEMKTIEITPVKRESLQVSQGTPQLPGRPVGASLGAFTHPFQVVQLADGRTVMLNTPGGPGGVGSASVNTNQIESLTQSIQSLTQQMERLQQAIDRLEKKSMQQEDVPQKPKPDDAP